MNKNRHSFTGLRGLAGATLLLLAAATVQAQSLTGSRESGFSYDAASGILTTEVVEPNKAEFCVRTEYGLDNYGNRTSSTTRSCTGAPADAQFSTRSTTSTYAAFSVTVSSVAYQVPAGTFATTVTNAKGHSESRMYDPRFGGIVSQTGPNALTTTWQYDDLGRVILEVSADGTRTATRHCILSGQGDTSANSSGCISSPSYKPAHAVAYVETQLLSSSGSIIGPYVRKYSDALGRTIREETQGFDAASQPSSNRVVVKDTEYNQYGLVERVTQPYFIDSSAKSSVAASGAPGAGWTRTEYDALGRPVAVQVRDEEGHISVSGAKVAQSTLTYDGPRITETRLRTSKNAQGSQQTVVTLTSVRVSNPLGQLVEVRDANNGTLRKRYDPFGNVIETQDALDNRVATVFDVRGRKKQMRDPSAGTWNYRYNALGEMTGQQSPLQTAGGQWTTLSYDVLGRMTQRSEPGDYNTTWTYDSCAKGVGKLCQTATDHGVTKTLQYDSLGRPDSTTQSVTGRSTSFVARMTYDSHGRLRDYTYPTGVRLQYEYTSLGYLDELKVSGSTVWRLRRVNAWGKAEMFDLRSSSMNTRQTFDPYTGRMQGVGVGDNDSILGQSYGWDTLGNLTDRTERYSGATQMLSESYDYDTLNRLAAYTTASPGLNGGLAKTVTIAYDAIGNILSKSDVGTYTYPASGAASVRPHAVTSVSGLVGSRSYTYDGAGNLRTATTSRYASLDYTSFNLPKTLSGGAASYEWRYGADHERVLEIRTASSVRRDTWYFHPDNANGLAFEQEVQGGSTPVNRHYISAMGRTIAVLETRGSVTSSSADSVQDSQYWHVDQLGSVTTITDGNGQVLQRFGYDPFGKRRQPNGTYDAAGNIIHHQDDEDTDRGFTGHEHLDDVGIIHMNGRTYDPLIGRFMQADPFIQEADLLQNYNRYSYVLNNPLNATDPSGQIFQLIPIIFATVGYEMTAAIIVNGVGAATCGAMTLGNMMIAAAVGSAMGAALAGADPNAIVRGAFAAAVGGAAFSAVGTLGGWHGVTTSPALSVSDWLAKSVAHGAVGCVQAAIGGGKCADGAMGATTAAALGFVVDDIDGGKQMKRLARAAIGGLASQAGGGRFANGAFSAAFAYMFNDDFANAGTSPEDNTYGGARDSGYTMFGPANNGVMFATEVGEAWLNVGATGSASLLRGAAKGALYGANYAQKTFGSLFSKGGAFAGRSVDDVAAALRSGAMKPSEVPIDFIVRDGNRLILNTRSAQALEAAGIPRSQWNAVNRTGQEMFENMLSGQLQRNGLTSEGIANVRRSGGF